MKQNKKFKWVQIIFVFIFIVGFFIYNEYIDRKSENEFQSINYECVIKDIRFIEGKRGLPDVQLNNKWYYLGYSTEIKIASYIHIGDSIVKKSGNVEIKVYRKDSLGTWRVKVFK